MKKNKNNSGSCVTQHSTLNTQNRSFFVGSCVTQNSKLKTQNRSCVSGFTLLELLIAMSLLVLIVSITMGALTLASRSVAAGERTTEGHERFRTVTAVLDAQIQSHLPLTFEEEDYETYYFRGTNKTMRLATNYSIWGGGRGYVIVNYRVAAGNGGKQTLYAAEQPPGIEAARETRLFTDASEIFFEYYHREPDEDTGQWSGEWSDELALPEKIRLHVVYGTKKLVFLFPLRAEGKMVLRPMTPPALTPLPQRGTDFKSVRPPLRQRGRGGI